MNHSYLDTGVAKQYVVRIPLIDFYTMYCTVFDMLKLVVQRITKLTVWIKRIVSHRSGHFLDQQIKVCFSLIIKSLH